ncbi:MAG: NSE2 family E3 SUMO-protein ligase [archaeon]|nr:NSE2 family E3 SUMO-protein ligase [archaeon]
MSDSEEGLFPNDERDEGLAEGGVDMMPTHFRLSVKSSDVSPAYSGLCDRAKTILAAAFELGVNMEQMAIQFSPDQSRPQHANPEDLKEVEEIISRCEATVARLEASSDAVRRLASFDGKQLPFNLSPLSSFNSSSSSSSKGRHESGFLENELKALTAEVAMARESERPSEAQVLAFREKLKELMPAEEQELGKDDDLLVVRSNSAVVDRCPILGGPMTDPRKNRACGHAYSCEGAMSLLRQKKAQPQRGRQPAVVEVKCPVPGCVKMLREEYLIKDPNLERELASVRRAQARASSAPSHYQVFDV